MIRFIIGLLAVAGIVLAVTATAPTPPDMPGGRTPSSIPTGRRNARRTQSEGIAGAVDESCRRITGACVGLAHRIGRSRPVGSRLCPADLLPAHDPEPEQGGRCSPDCKPHSSTPVSERAPRPGHRPLQCIEIKGVLFRFLWTRGRSRGARARHASVGVSADGQLPRDRVVVTLWGPSALASEVRPGALANVSAWFAPAAPRRA